MDPANRQRLRKNHVYLKENLQILDVLDLMYEKRVFNDDEAELVRSRETTGDKCQLFLDLLRRKGNEGYTIFCEVLKKLQPSLLKTLEDTEIDKDMLGETASSNIFFDPSDDFELKGLIDELTKDNSITTDQLERMKHFVIGEPGCAEEIIEKIPTPIKFLRHLMKSRLLTRYNLAFLQALLWRVGNKNLCLQVAQFARTISQKPVYFYSPPKQAENGYAFGKFHIEGNVEQFKGITIDDICERVSRYLGIPLSQVIPMGVEPSASIVLTIMLPQGAMETMKSLGNWLWLADLRIDYIEHDNGRILFEDFHEDIPSQNQVLERELKRRMETEQHLKQCLYEEQVSNENLKDIQTQLEQRLHDSEIATKELNRFYMRVFAALLVSFHFIAGLLEAKGKFLVSRSQHFLFEMYNTQFQDALKNAKRWSCNPDSLMQLVEATKRMEHLKDRVEIDYLRKLTNTSLTAMQLNMMEAATMRMCGGQPILQEPNVSISLVCELDPMFVDILKDLSNKLSKEQLQKICNKFNVPEQQQTADLKSRTIVNILYRELSKPGNQEMSMEVIDTIIQTCFKEAGRFDLWKEFRTKKDALLKSRTTPQQKRGHTEHKSKKKETEIADRLDKMEKLLQTVVEQTKRTVAERGFDENSFGDISSFQNLFRNNLKNLDFPFKTYGQGVQ